MNSFDHGRRIFVKACGALAISAAAGMERLTQPAFALERAPRLKLVDKAGQPIKASALEKYVNYIFPYPYVSTPCLLLRLGDATPRNLERKGAKNASYVWPGGVGKDGAVVAYSAICAHALTYDSKQTSFLTYSKGMSQLSGHDHAITCCAHGSVYDPASGAKVLGGPAKFSLAAVQLDYDAESDELTAVGMVGTALFDEFFKTYRAELNSEFGRGAYRALLKEHTTVLPMQDYSENVVRC